MTESGESSAVMDQAALEAWGRAVGEAVVAGGLRLPLVVALRGPLGAGKSVLARAVARGAGVTSPMPSPTYNLLFTYRGHADVEVVHLDLYRIEDPDDIWELGWQDLAEGDQVVLIEWPERAEERLPPDRWDARLAFPDGSAAEGPESELRVVRLERVGGAQTPPPLPGESP